MNPYRFTVPTQPAPAVISRSLLSLALIAASALAFRATLVPVSAGTRQQLVQIQSEPVARATRARVSLNAVWANLVVGGGASASDALSGTVTLPNANTLKRQSSRDGGTLKASYGIVQNDGRPIPLRLFWGGDGLGFGNSPGNLGIWAVRLSQILPTELTTASTSGDQTLDLVRMQLNRLTVNSTSGEVNAALPSSFSGNSQFILLSGHLTVSVTGQANLLSAAPVGTFEAATGSGDQNLDLSRSGYKSVDVGSASGDLNVVLPARQRVVSTLISASGEQNVKVPAGVIFGKLNINSASGDLSVTLPAEAAVSVDANSASGEVSLPSSYVRRGQTNTYLSPAAADGNQPLQVSLASLSGDIHLEEAGK